MSVIYFILAFLNAILALAAVVSMDAFKEEMENFEKYTAAAIATLLTSNALLFATALVN